ncbi:MAG: PD-(D/E)XK nuclease family protein [Clostridia bacterium]|nr:PD-(D/E)XK nuclease family protein [Clostridia bacterium]
MLRLIYGCPGGGKSRYMAEQIAARQRAGAKVILLVPERFSLGAERQICALCGQYTMNVEVLSFKRLCNRVFREYGGLCYHYADKGGQLLMMHRALGECRGELEQLGALTLSDKNTVAAIHQSMISFKRGGVDWHTLEELADDPQFEASNKLKSKLRDHARIGRTYDRLLQEGYDDPEEDLTRLCTILDQHPFFADKEVFVDATTAFSAREFGVLERVLAQGAPLTVTLPMRVKEERAFFEKIRYCKEKLCELARKYNRPVVDDPVVLEEPYLKTGEDLRHLEKQLFTEVPTPFSGKAEKIVLEQCTTAYEECKRIAARILKDVQEAGGRYRDHAVAVRNMEQYKGLLEGVFDANGIPYVSAAPVKLAQRGASKTVLTVLRLYTGRFRFEQLLEYLKSGYCPLAEQECFLLEDYAVLWHIEGMRWVKDAPFTMNPDGHTALRTEQTALKLQQLNQLKQRLAQPFKPLFAGLDAAKSATDYARALYEFLLAIGIKEQLKAQALQAQEQERGQEAQLFAVTFRELCGVLDQLVSVYASSPMKAEEFLWALETLLQERTIGTLPAGQDRVLVSDVFNLKPTGVRCLYVAGMNEGVFPAAPSQGGLFSNADLEALSQAGVELAKDAFRQVLDEQYLAYCALTLPYGFLYISCHQKNLRGSTCRPSEIFEELDGIFKARKEEEHDLLYGRSICLERAVREGADEESAALRAYFEEESRTLFENLKNAPLIAASDAISPRQCERLYGTDALKISKSRLETFINCPFSYTCSYVLGLKEKQGEYTGANEIGTLFHSVFEELVQGTKNDGIPFGSLTDVQIEARVTDIVKNLSKGMLDGEEDEDRIFAQLMRRVKNAAVVFSKNLRDEFEESAFEPAFCELQFGAGREGEGKLTLAPVRAEGEHPVVINGIADRVDVYKSEDKIYLRVVDYKTGKELFRPEKVQRGLNLQMLLYLRALRDCRDERFLAQLGAGEHDQLLPAGIQYYLAGHPGLSLEKKMTGEEIRRAIGAGITRSGWLIDDQEVLDAMGKIGAGDLKGKDPYVTDISALNDRLDTLDDILSDIAGQIKEGSALATPDGVSAGDVGCKYCKMRPVCRKNAENKENEEE